MIDFKVRFSGRAHTYTDEEIERVVSVMRNAETLTQGRYLHEFEAEFARYINSSNAFAVNNATSGLELAALCCTFAPGDEVIIPAHTYTSSAYPFIKHGAKIVWADIDRESRVVTAEQVTRCLTSATRAIVIPHLYGFASDVEEIMRLVSDRDVIVIEDTAQSLGSEVGGQKAGAIGDIGIFSFHSHKNVSTLGEGGMVCTRDTRFAQVLPMLRHNGHCAFDNQGPDYWIPAMSNVDLPEISNTSIFPSNFCLGEVECALGTVLLDRIDKMNIEKRSRALNVIDAFQSCPELSFHRVDSPRHNYHLLAAELVTGQRDEFIRLMAYEKGVQCVVQYYPLYRYPLYQKAGLGEADCPNTDRFFDNMVSFPFQHSLSDSEIEYVIESAKSVLSGLRKK